MNQLFLLLLTLVVLIEQSKADKNISVLDTLWDIPTLYESKTGFINEIRLIGQYHGQFHALMTNDAEDHEWENRATRAGIKISMLDRKLNLVVEANSSVSYDPIYQDLNDAFLDFKPQADGLNFRIGKWQSPFGHEYGIPYREIITFENSAFVNQLGIGFTSGARLGYQKDKWLISETFFSNKVDSEFGQLDGGYTSLSSISYDLGDEMALDKSLIKLDWMHSQVKAEDNRFQNFDDVCSLSYTGVQGKYGLNADLVWASTSRGQGVHLMLEPIYDVNEAIQLVCRAQLSFGNESEMLSPQRRYDQRVDAPRGDSYQALYLGVNYRIHGNRFKIMNGLEISSMSGGPRDNQEITLLSGVLVYF